MGPGFLIALLVVLGFALFNWRRSLLVAGSCLGLTALLLIGYGFYGSGQISAAVTAGVFLGVVAATIVPLHLKKPLSRKVEFKYCPNCTCKLAERLIEDKPKMACPRCNFVYWNNPVVVGVAIIPSPDLEEVVLVQRDIDPQAGLWCMPGGFAEPNEDAPDTASRESGEETKLGIEIERLFAVRKAPTANQILIFYLAKPMSTPPQKGSDARDARFCRLDQLPELAFTTHAEVLAMWAQEAVERKAKQN